MVMNNSMFITATTACLPESSCYIISVYLHNKLDAGMLQPIDCCRDREWGGRKAGALRLSWLGHPYLALTGYFTAGPRSFSTWKRSRNVVEVVWLSAFGCSA